ncbi:MAG: hypothetical protein J6J03_00525 [Tyzzerella sp.]|nr:hypothetical protein [Tyzzerella sp.]
MYDEETGNSVPIPVEELSIEDKQELEFFYDNTVRKVWNPNEEEWYFSIVDVCQVLTDSVDATSYWRKLKQRLLSEGNETVTNCHGLKKYKMKAFDGKMRFTDCANTEQLLRIIQSIPSKKAEPFKQWLARVGKERLDEMANPELAFERAIRTYREKGYTEKWIEQRLHAIDVRKQLTAEWDRAGVKQQKEYAALTSILTKAWSGKSVKEYKQFKGLKKESLRDNMTNIELALNQLAEVSATAIAKAKKPTGFSQTKDTVVEGGAIAGNARKELEKSIGQSVISPRNASIPDLLEISEEAEK